MLPHCRVTPSRKFANLRTGFLNFFRTAADSRRSVPRGRRFAPISWSFGEPVRRLEIRWYPFIHLGEERHCVCKVSCLRTQHSALAEAQTRTIQSGVQRTNHWATAPPNPSSKLDQFTLQVIN